MNDNEEILELIAAVNDLLSWAGPIAGDNMNSDDADFEERTVERVKEAMKALGYV